MLEGRRHRIKCANSFATQRVAKSGYAKIAGPERTSGNARYRASNRAGAARSCGIAGAAILIIFRERRQDKRGMTREYVSPCYRSWGSQSKYAISIEDLDDHTHARVDIVKRFVSGAARGIRNDCSCHSGRPRRFSSKLARPAPRPGGMLDRPGGRAREKRWSEKISGLKI